MRSTGRSLTSSTRIGRDSGRSESLMKIAPFVVQALNNFLSFTNCLATLNTGARDGIKCSLMKIHCFLSRSFIRALKTLFLARRFENRTIIGAGSVEFGRFGSRCATEISSGFIETFKLLLKNRTRRASVAALDSMGPWSLPPLSRLDD